MNRARWFTAAGLLVLLALASFDAAVWRHAKSLSPPHLVNESHGIFAPALLLLCVVTAFVMTLVLLLRKSAVSRGVGVGVGAATVALFVWFQRFWLLGVFVFGGGRYWVHRAAQTPSDEQARAYLRVVLSASQYGVNVAENAVLAERNPATQRRLFLLLASCAPNDNWREQYLIFANGWRRGQATRGTAK